MSKILTLFFALFLYGANVDKKIKYTKQNLFMAKTEISNMNNALDSIVKKINNSEIYLNNINRQISKLNKKIVILQQSLTTKKSYLTKLEIKKNKLLNKKNYLQKEVIDFISSNYYIQNKNAFNEKDLISDEIFRVVTKESAKKMTNISDFYSKIDNQIIQISSAIKNIKNAKLVLQKRRREMSNLKIKQKRYIENLQAIKLKYRKELQKIISNQNQFQTKLSKLNVIKSQEVKKQREIIEKELAEAKRREKREKEIRVAKKINPQINKQKVKNYGNIYMSSKTIRYRGSKTIAPLSGKIVKRFGAYTDPVYKIALYNDSITIKTKPNSKVKAIFSGRVVFVGNTNEGKMIVVKHRNRLHSIYAKLTRVSPFIKKGYRVKKGEVIAKVDKELEFEITYKTLPINPLKVVRF